ncbi:flagellar basal body P-ring protein FlgI [Adhaeretor mobilis]|uniref:Flagellar basal body P-ring protein n=1 Tax=Adhaeretor mobilis TaxID=1930276 RepID=A0A517MSD1_9BACT|nr:flagellar basal body P-ring protein FlgI [Adhaeretor mobilis]QDS97778.1 flagellar basal body P-ring protein [Adhaeretor mobilis]
MGHSYHQHSGIRLAIAGLGCALLALTGCMGPILRQQSPDAELTEAAAQDNQLVGGVAHPHGMGYMKVEAIGLVTGLNSTGGDPPLSGQRAGLLAEMNRMDIEDPNAVLASPQTAMVMIRGLLHPGIQEGDKFDIEVATMARSETSSLRGGWLMDTRLTETAVLGGQVRKGHPMGLAEGAIMVDPSSGEDGEEGHTTRGRILGGGVAKKSRGLGLIIDHQHQSIRLSQAIGKSINNRFHSYDEGQREGVATPKTDEYVELRLHPRYKDNVSRFMRVVRSIPLRESPSQRQTRLGQLRDQLLDPVTTSTAALRLEAMGDEQAITVLQEGVKSEDAEVRFRAAEALAYLDVTEAVETLANVARDEPAFRAEAFLALSAMDDGVAYEELTELLSTKSAETRYGAFRSIWHMAPGDPLIRSQAITDKFGYHILDVKGPAMVHVTRSHRPEVVLFGKHHRLQTPLVLDAGPRIMINGDGDEIKISRFGVNEPTQQRTVSTDLDAVIRAIVDLGGDYPDVVQMLQQAKETGVLPSRFKVNALPEGGRRHARETENTETTVETGKLKKQENV